MFRFKREISKEIYDRAIANNGKFASKEDWNAVFTLAESCGYGIYGYSILEEDGKYYVWFDRGSTCD